jgi:3-hydroxyisobutyrate dehydrogenase-like beta-hydroxyacid dehydrogenase
MTTRPLHSATAGILYCGDMGAVVGRLLAQAGFRVVTTSEGRSAATKARADEAGIEVLESIGDVASQSDIVFSIVLPSAAEEVARRYAEFSALRPPGSIFVDANTVGHNTLATIAQIMAAADIQWIDAGIHGTAGNLARLGVIYVSGPDSPHLQSLTAQTAVRVVRLGDVHGLASSMKLLMAAMSKSTAAAFFEIATLAEQLGMLESFLENYESFYPEIMHAIRRTLPTYPTHASRRIGELRNLEERASAASLSVPLMHEVGNVISRLAAIEWDAESRTAQDIAPVIRSARSLLAGEASREGEIR